MKNKQEASSNDLSVAKSFARSVPNSGDRYVVHHIVAQSDHRAALAQGVLRSVDIDPATFGLSLAVIPESKHLPLHTNSYFSYINKRFEGLTDNYPAVIFTLAELQVEIQIYAQTGWKAW